MGYPNRQTHHRCLDCGATFSSNSSRRARERYGRELQCYVVYNLIQLHLSQYKLAHYRETVWLPSVPVMHRPHER
jgi:hypothetical protein